VHDPNVGEEISVARESPRIAWVAAVIATGILLPAAWGAGALVLGAPAIIDGIRLIWEILLLVAAMFAVGLLAFSLSIEPGRIRLSDSGVAFGSSKSLTPIPWEKLDPPSASIYGIWVRRTVKTPLGVIHPGHILSPAQFRALVQDSRCPRWPLSKRLLKRAGLPPGTNTPLR
jgi:hypothetical protein